MKTQKKQKVMIALDYDPSAQAVAEQGYSIAKSMGAEVILLHVITEPVYYSSAEYSPIMGFSGYLETSAIQLNNLEGLRKASNHYLDKTRLHLADETIKNLVAEGDLADAILKSAKDQHAGLIVIGSHSRNWLKEIVVGSTTEKVIHKSNIPVVIIPVGKD